MAGAEVVRGFGERRGWSEAGPRPGGALQAMEAVLCLQWGCRETVKAFEP